MAVHSKSPKSYDRHTGTHGEAQAGVGGVPDTVLGLRGERSCCSAFYAELAEQDSGHSGKRVCSPTWLQGICSASFLSHPLETD